MGDKTRFCKFALMVQQYIPLEARVVDVAGGKGYLQMALRQLGYRDVTSWDKRKKYSRGRGYRYGWFSWNCQEPYDAVVAMHPDEGTDHALIYAARRGVPALVCPCCIRPSAENFWGQHKYGAWCQHLEKLVTDRGGGVSWLKLGMSGRNDVMLVTGGK